MQAQALKSYVNLSKLPKKSEPHFPHVENGNINTYFIRVLEELHEMSPIYFHQW